MVKRSRASAKQAGTRFESSIANYLNEYCPGNIERRARTGAKDRGDIAGLFTLDGGRVVVECKDYGGRVEVGKWLGEVETERINDDAPLGVVIAKRRGTTDPAQQIVLMTVADLICLIGARSVTE